MRTHRAVPPHGWLPRSPRLPSLPFRPFRRFCTGGALLPPRAPLADRLQRCAPQSQHPARRNTSTTGGASPSHQRPSPATQAPDRPHGVLVGSGPTPSRTLAPLPNPASSGLASLAADATVRRAPHVFGAGTSGLIPNRPSLLAKHAPRARAPASHSQTSVACRPSRADCPTRARRGSRPSLVGAFVPYDSAQPFQASVRRTSTDSPFTGRLFLRSPRPRPSARGLPFRDEHGRSRWLQRLRLQFVALQPIRPS